MRQCLDLMVAGRVRQHDVGGAPAARLTRQRDEGGGILRLVQFHHRQPQQQRGSFTVTKGASQVTGTLTVAGGSGNIDAKNQMTFEIVPPGRYVLRGQPNPGSSNEQTDPLTVDLKGGQVSEVTLKAK